MDYLCLKTIAEGDPYSVVLTMLAPHGNHAHVVTDEVVPNKDSK